jgi:hypothetical protein
LGGQVNWVAATYSGDGFSALLLEAQPGLDVCHAVSDHHLRQFNSSQQGFAPDATLQSRYSLSGIIRG